MHSTCDRVAERRGASRPRPPPSGRRCRRRLRRRQRAARMVAGAERLEGEHDARQLAARGDARQRTGVLAEVRRPGRTRRCRCRRRARSAARRRWSGAARTARAAMPSSASAPSIAAPSVRAAAWRAADSRRAPAEEARRAASSAGRGGVLLLGPPAERVVLVLRAPRSWRSTSASVGPCLRFSRSIWASRSSTCCRRSGEASSRSW